MDWSQVRKISYQWFVKIASGGEFGTCLGI